MHKTLSLTIEGDDILGRYIARRYTSGICRLLRMNHGNMQVNGRVVHADCRLRRGDRLVLSIPETSRVYDVARDVGISVVYLDDDVMVIDKPPRVASMPTEGYYDSCVQAGLTYLFPGRVFRVVTRLDKDTSGLMLIAMHALSHAVLSQSPMTKRYTLLMTGRLESRTIIDAPIARMDKSIIRYVGHNGKPAQTIFEPVCYTPDGDTLANAYILTGRTHQIRVHAAHIGHPVVGDTLYGSATGAYNSGQRLRCTRLEFTHPLTSRQMTFESDPFIPGT